MGRGNKTQKSALKNQRVTPHGTGISGDKGGVFAGESDASVPHPDGLPKGKVADVQELQAALDERYPDGRWLRLLEVLGVTGVADSVQIREGSGLSREQTENLLKGLMELDGRIVRLLPFTVPRAGSRGRPAAVYGLGEVGAAMLRAAGYADARTCGLNDVRAVAHARAVLDVRLLAQRAGLEVWTEREFSSAAEDGIVIRPDNAVRLADGTCAFFEVEQDARLPQLRRIVDSLRRRAAFYRSGGVTGVSRTVRVLFAVGEGKAWERTMEVWRKAVVMVAEESGGDLPFRLVGMRMNAFVESPDWEEPSGNNKWWEPLQELQERAQTQDSHLAAKTEAADRKSASPSGRKGEPESGEALKKRGPLSDKTALPNALRRRVPADDRRILQAYWQHLLEQGPELAYTAQYPRPDPAFFEVMEVIYGASHGSKDVRREAAYPYASVYLLRKYLEMHPGLREAVGQAMARGAGTIRWSVTLVMHRMQGVIETFLRYHGYRVNRYLEAVPVSPYEREEGPQDFRIRVRVHPELLIGEGEEVMPGREEVRQAEEALEWVLWALFAYAGELQLKPPPFW